MKIIQLLPENITREILDILCELSSTKQLPLSRAKKIIQRQIECDHFTYLVCEEDLTPVGIGSILICHVLIRNGGKIGMIENVAVRKDCQRKGYGKKLIQYLKRVGKKNRCYKTILSAADKNVEFYKRCGFDVWVNTMRIDFK